MSIKINYTDREVDEIFHEVRKNGYYWCNVYVDKNGKTIRKVLYSCDGRMYDKDNRYYHPYEVEKVFIDEEVTILDVCVA